MPSSGLVVGSRMVNYMAHSLFLRNFRRVRECMVGVLIFPLDLTIPDVDRVSETLKLSTWGLSLVWDRKCPQE